MQGHTFSQEQVAKALPEQILASSVLRMSAVELAQYVTEQMAENPALSIEDVEQCPVCGTPIYDYACPLCGASPSDSSEEPEIPEDEWMDHPNPDINEPVTPGEDFDPFMLIASPMDLQGYLRSQVRVLITDPEELRIALFIIEALDDDGFLREDLYDVAASFKVSVPDVEKVLSVIQSLDPPGIGARDVKECLLLQLGRLEEDRIMMLTFELISRFWDDLAKQKIPQIAESLLVGVDDIRLCIEFMRDRLNPRPAALYRAPWAELAPNLQGQIVPDVVIRMRDESPVVEVLDFQAGLLKLDEEYDSASSSGAQFSQEERKHVKEFVDKARCILDAVQLRRQTLAKIALSLAERQKDYIVSGPRGLKPLKQKELAAEIGIHESTVCRALNGKFVRLPSGEVVPFDTFFDASLPIKEMIRTILASSSGQPLSDSEIARRLAEEGVEIARRTVAKYRDQLRVPSYQLRG